MLTYRGRIESGDTLRAMDAMTSRSRYGDLLMDESVWFQNLFRVRRRSELPLNSYDVDEKLNITLAMPLLKLAESIPSLGNIHTVWLFNVLVTSLSIGLLYGVVRATGYDDKVAVGVALTAGLATNMWAYSQTFFREPLVSFFVLLGILGVQLAYRRGWIRWIISVVWVVVLLHFAYQSKFSAMMLFPAVAILAIPHISFLDNQKIRRLSLILLLIQIVGFLIVAIFEPFPDIVQSFVSRFSENPDFFAYALRVYVLSPGASIWGTSPVLLLSIGGSILLLRQKKHRIVWMVWLALVGYASGHALVTGVDWFGGLSWPPRFLVPIIPILMIAAAPVLDLIFAKKHKLLAALWILLLAYGIWIQFSSVSLMWYQYEGSLPPESNGLTEWEPGFTQIQYFRWVVLPQRWVDLGLDFLWSRTGTLSWAIEFSALIILVLGTLLWVIRKPRSSLPLLIPIFGIAWCGLVLINLRAVYDKDPVIQSHKQALFDMLDYVTANSVSDDILILPNNFYERFILNHLDVAKPRPIILQPELAEPASERQPAEVVSNNPNDWLPLGSLRIIHHIAANHDRFWYLANTSPFMSWSFRPFERYMALYYYPLREIELEHPDETVRLLEYSTRQPAPNPFSTFNADYATDLQYGDHIQLSGFHLPNGVIYHDKQAIELSLQWQTDTVIEQDYTVAWFVANKETGQFVAQGQDSMPQAGFAPTTSWQPQVSVWDNRALRLPDDLPEGEYEIWVLLYRYNPDTNAIDRLPVRGETVIDSDTIGVLPITLLIN